MFSSNSSDSGDSLKHRKKRIKKESLIITLWKEFAAKTSVPGVKFIAQDDMSLLEKLLWAILILVGIGFTIGFSYKLWYAWDSHPVVITVQSANTQINTRLFPTVTVCSVNKVSTRDFQWWINRNPGTSVFTLDELRRIMAILQTNRVDNEDEIITLSYLMYKANISSNHRGYEIMLDAVSPNCSAMAIFCSWEGKEKDCEQVIGIETTDDGYCCSFNSVIATKDGPIQSAEEMVYSRNTGVQSGYTIILNAEQEDYNVTSSPSTGFRISIQAPEDIPATGRVGFLASPGSQLDIAVTGQMQMADEENVKFIDQKHRKCVTKNEIKLNYFDDYTKQYCELDCLVRLFMADCHCVPYYFPISELLLPTCNLSAYNCIEKNIRYQVKNSSACDCPDLCNAAWYQTEISYASFPNERSGYPASLKKRPEFSRMSPTQFKEYGLNNFVKVNVYFKSLTGLGYIMDHSIYWADYLAATGGLLGLGFGFSIISFFEIVYFLLIRWIYYWVQAKKRAEAMKRRRHQRHYKLTNVVERIEANNQKKKGAPEVLLNNDYNMNWEASAAPYLE